MVCTAVVPRLKIIRYSGLTINSSTAVALEILELARSENRGGVPSLLRTGRPVRAQQLVRAARRLSPACTVLQRDHRASEGVTITMAVLLLLFGLSCCGSLAAGAALLGDREASTPVPDGAASGSTPIDIANSTQLFVDDFLIATKTANLVRSLHRPDCSRVAVTTDALWELNYTMGIGGTNVILHEDGRLQLWYSLRNSTLGCTKGKYDPHNDQPPCSAHGAPQPNFEPSAGNIYIGYAESTDSGLTFYKPLQHKYTVRGSTANNFVTIASPGANCLSIFVDPNEPSGSPKRYRGTSADLSLTSPDGKNWSAVGRMTPSATIPAASDEGMPGHVRRRRPPACPTARPTDHLTDRPPLPPAPFGSPRHRSHRSTLSPAVPRPSSPPRTTTVQQSRAHTRAHYHPSL